MFKVIGGQPKKPMFRALRGGSNRGSQIGATLWARMQRLYPTENVQKHSTSRGHFRVRLSSLPKNSADLARDGTAEILQP